MDQKVGHMMIYTSEVLTFQRIPVVMLSHAHIRGLAQTIKMVKLADTFFTDIP